ncbi:hypothetical protein DdX_17611 [Ditylenchus destructor]|uniref:Uncharacterized protein n=1 Tax=Ditylenchus destructor TaxID=166010 RepID=A0AAD4MLE5_9BILA|nr:hypothetical protein DdX_17611 [Ditylenchus destructor]
MSQSSPSVELSSSKNERRRSNRWIPNGPQRYIFSDDSDSESDSDYEKGDCHTERKAVKVNGQSPNTNVDGRRYSLRPRTASKRNSFGNCNKALGSQHFSSKPTEVDVDLDDECEIEDPTPAKCGGRALKKSSSSVRKSTEVELDLDVKYESEGPTPAKRRGRPPIKLPSSTRQATDVHLDIEDECETEGPSPAKCRGRSPEKSPSRATPKFKNMVDPIEIIIVKKLEQPTLLLSNNHYTAIIMSEKQDDYDVLQALRQRMEIVSNDGVYYARNSFEANWVSIEAVLRSFGFVEDEFAFNNEFSASKKDSWKFVRSV